jgi:hypothetical protein
VPEDYGIYIQFEPRDGDNNQKEIMDFWVYRKYKESKTRDVVFEEWNIDMESTKLDSLLKLSPLKREDLNELKKYLNNANCISVSNINEFEIGFAYSGMGKYFYLILDEPLTHTEKNMYNDGCHYIFYKDNIVLEYQGGAIGPQCFPDKEQ